MVVLLLVSFTLCNGDKNMQIQPMKGPAPELYVMPLVTSRYKLPDEYGKAQATFDDAKKLYEAGKPDQAAPLFIKVAELVKAPKPETTYSESFAKMRAVAYEDAAIAYREAGDAKGLEAALNKALKNDPENAATLKKLLGKK
jgi:tetratricopeptide (TPR) repeat protein